MYTTQVDAMRDVVEILRNTNELFGRWGAISDNTRIGLIEVLNHMIEVRTKPLTDEQRERKNEAAKKHRIAKRQKRDDLIYKAIEQYLETPHSADELANIVNTTYDRDVIGYPVSNSEIHHFFDRHRKAFQRIEPKACVTYKAWD